ncbi:hypothetical protein EDC96DRAFT_51427 [Choanephora cucurbitarum]|nr:hypothetical protein EDC96DRAFT_51427 [Choanephora cucurbitarum]
MLVKEETMEIEGLPFQVHVDDAKDKVFVAILRSLVILKNTPSSPKKLAATIIEHRLAKLGGQTPFATVSSRISQHFKRSASHESSRKPLLIKHMDEQHARKSRYSIDDCLLQSPIQAKHEISLRTSNSPALEANEQDIAAAITITKMSQQPHYKESRLPQPETIDAVGKNTEETPKVKTRQETIQGHTFTLTKRWLGYLELHELDSPSDIPNTKVSRFSSTDPKLSYSYVNATQLRKAAIPVLGEGVFDIERERREGGGIAVVISSGPLESNDVWIPLERARELMEEFEIESSPGLTRLLSDELLSECFSDGMLHI